MNDNEIQYLEKAINNEKNEFIVDLTFDKIERKKKEILDELNLSKKETRELFKKLDNYRYVEEIQELQYGNYIRWINLTNPDNLKLATGGILCEIKIEDNIYLVIKNFMNRHFQINMDENLLFQKLSEQEMILLYALDYVNK